MRVVLCILLGAYLLLLLVLNFGPSRAFLTKTLQEAIADKLHTEVSIGDVQVGLFNRLIISDVKINDQKHRPLLSAERVTAKIELRSLLADQLSLRTVSLLDADIRLCQEKADEPTNFQFVLDAFSSKSPKKESKLNLRINSIILRRVNLAYDQWFKPATPHRLNLSHLHVQDINANVSLKSVNAAGLRLRVRSLAFRESSGLDVRNICLKLNANRRGATVQDFEVSLPHSRIRQSSLVALYDATKGWDNLWPTLRMRGDLNEAVLSTDDVRFLLSLPQSMHLVAKLNTSFLVIPSKIQLNNLSLQTEDADFQIQGDVTLQRSSSRFTEVFARVPHLEVKRRFTADALQWVKADTLWSRRVQRLGNLSLSGFGRYRFKADGNANLSLKTDAGALDVDAFWKFSRLNAGVRLHDVHVASVLGNERLPQHASADVQTQVDFDGKRVASAKADARVTRLNWNSHEFRPIHLQASWDGGMVSGQLQSDDPLLHVQTKMRGAFDGKHLDDIHLQADLQSLQPSVLGLGSDFGKAVYSASVQADLRHLRQALPQGEVSVSDFHLQNGPHGDYSLQHLDLSLTSHQRGAQAILHSDFADATLQGPASIAELTDGIRTIAQRTLPHLMPAPRRRSQGEWALALDLKKTDVLHQLAGVDLSLASPLHVQGILHAGDGRTSLTASTAGVRIGGTELERPAVYLHGQGSHYELLAQANKQISGRDYKLEARLTAADSALLTSLSWKGRTGRKYEGELEAQTRFSPSSGNGVDFVTDIRPTQFFLADTVWNVASGRFALQHREVDIHHVMISRPGQSLMVDGRLSPHTADSIVAQLHNIDISYILGIVDFDAVEFGGLASGQAVFTQTPTHPQLHAQLHIPDFRFNGGPMGSTDIAASWSNADKRIHLNADMHLPDGQSGTQVKGYVSPAEKGLDLNITARRTNLRFLRRYMDGIFGNFEGDATGFVRLYGPFKKLDFQGEMMANAKARILSTGVDYEVKDGAVHLVPGAFQFEHFTIDDRRHGRGTADGALRHQHLKNLTYDFDITADHLLCYDKPQEHDMPFYSTTYGTGNVHLAGRPGQFEADINLTPEQGTTLVYTLGGSDAVSAESAMVHFREAKPQFEADSLGWAFRPNAERDQKPEAESAETYDPGTDIVLNLFIDANPNAQVKIITDPRAGDNLTVYGYGPIRATYHNKGAFEMYGTYHLTRGTYKLSIQDIIRKDLVIDQGSSLTFAGDPLSADLDLKAKYTVNGVSLSDLNYGAGFSQKSVKVDCLLNIGGQARAPRINFDLDLHNISEDEKQMVRQLISTDEDMNRQIIYLLGIGRFYTAANAGSLSQVSSQQQSSAAMRSFLSTTLTGQLNSAISNVLGNQSHWNFGANLNPGTYGWDNMEVEGLLEGRLFNDRLLINGNFGYRDSPTYNSNFVGDFDIRYLLTPRGTVSLRAYSETTDRYFTKNSLTTQGIGVTLQRDFRKIRDLFLPQRKRKLAFPYVEGEK